jgi:hypothetical protein
MKTRKRFYLMASIMMLMAIPLLLGTIVPTLTALADGDSSFIEHTIAGNFDGAYSVYATDVDGDGNVDVLGAAYDADDITWWENNSDESFTEHTIAGNFNGARSVYATDVDGDDDVDVLGAAYYDGIAWWENDGDENFAEHAIASYRTHLVYATDVDGDDDIDVLGTVYSTYNYTWRIIWWENDGSENFTVHTVASSSGPDYTGSISATDLDGDGDMDLLVGGDHPVWWENDGSENFTAHTIYSAWDSTYSLCAADLDGDGDVDVLGTAFDDDDVVWWENDGDENFTRHIIDSYFEGARSVYASDVDDDGDVDVLGAAATADDVAWWENDGDENFTEHTIADNFDGARSVYAIDVDGDGDVDVLSTASVADDITWWEQVPALSISDVSITEGDGGSVNAVFSVTLSITSTQVVMVEYATADGSATAPADYTAILSTTLTFPPGASTRFITVSVQGDTEDELDEIFWVNLANPVNASLSDAQGQGTILDDDGCVVYLPLILRNAGPPLPPVLDDISNPDGDGNYTVSWSAVSGATTYTLEEDDNDAFSSPTTVYLGSSTSKSVSSKDVGTYYYQVQASNSFGSSDWSNIELVKVTVEPPPCDVSCSTPSGYCTGSWTVNISCESGSFSSSKNCYLVSDPVWGTITHCDVTRTYSLSGRTYYMDVEYWNVYPSKCYLRAWVWGGVFGSDKQYCKNY